jgi:beta-galactosidase
MHYGQAFLAWTFNSHLGGEEQALFGLIDHDDRPSWKLKEWGQIASEFRQLQKLGFPRYDKPQVAIHYSYDTNWLTNPPPGGNTMKEYFKVDYGEQVKAAFAPLFRDNLDAAVLDIGHDPIDDYKLVVLSSAYLVDQKISRAVRSYVAKGGTVIMTGYSAKVDETGKWFNTPLPGGLTDVFGLRTNEFYRSEQPLQVAFNGQTLTGSDSYYEVLEPSTATPLATFANTPQKSPAITVNKFGKGRAIYLATAAQPEFIGPLIRSLYPALGITPGPATPDGVSARAVNRRTLYVNTKSSPVTVRFNGTKTGLLTHKTYAGKIDLPGYGVELLQ